MYQIIQYLKFLITSTNHHGVHSPFVYSLVTKCFYDKSNYPTYKELSSYRKALFSNRQKISIIDLGAGSRRSNAKQRSVMEIAKTSGTTLKRAKLLFRLINYFKPKMVLELGTSLGIATQAMALGNKVSIITTVEGCKTIQSFAEQQINAFDIHNVIFKNENFEDYLSSLKNENWDLIFFDGNHQEDATLRYFENLLNFAHTDSVFIFDDIYWSKGMTNAWNTIKQHPKVTVTIDTFFWGLVFFKKELTKENFKIRL